MHALGLLFLVMITLVYPDNDIVAQQQTQSTNPQTWKELARNPYKIERSNYRYAKYEMVYVNRFHRKMRDDSMFIDRHVVSMWRGISFSMILELIYEYNKFSDWVRDVYFEMPKNGDPFDRCASVGWELWLYNHEVFNDEERTKIDEFYFLEKHSGDEVSLYEKRLVEKRIALEYMEAWDKVITIYTFKLRKAKDFIENVERECQ